MNYPVFTWPVILLAAAIVLVIGLLVAWGVQALERRNRAESRAERLQQLVGEAMVHEPLLTGASILPVASFPVDGRPVLELTGYVPSEQARQRARLIAEHVLRAERPGIELRDRLEILPSLTDRRRPA